MGVLVGTGMGGLQVFQDGVQNLVEKGYKKISPFFIPYAITNMCASALCELIGGPIKQSARLIGEPIKGPVKTGTPHSTVCAARLNPGGLQGSRVPTQIPRRRHRRRLAWRSCRNRRQRVFRGR